MFGGGIFESQNKVLPGAYINFVAKETVKSNLGARGFVAMALNIGKSDTKGKIIKATKDTFTRDAKELFGVNYTDAKLLPVREALLHATTVYVVDLGEASASDESKVTVDQIKTLYEQYEINTIVCYSDNDADKTAYIAMIKEFRDAGKKCQLVVHNATTPDDEGVINVTTDAAGDTPYALVAWVGGAEAGCAVNSSCTNMRYDGELTVTTNKSQADLEKAVEGGQFVFHSVYGEVRTLEDINSLTSFDEKKNEDFRYNQTIRVIDQIANDMAKIFNNYFLGKIPNNESGRASLWGRIEAHHRELEKIQAIDSFDSSLLTVEQGKTKRSVVVSDVVTPVNAMEQLYMTVVID